MKKIRTSLGKILSRIITPPVFFLLLCILAYGLLIPVLGFYWDDWFLKWISHSLGSSGVFAAVASDRPASGLLYVLTTTLLGEAPLPWHIFALLSRWLCTVAAWWTLCGIWPDKRRETTAMASLFAVYPGFTQQPISIIYSHVFIVLAFTLVSFGAMIQTIRIPQRFWPYTLLAVLCLGFGLINIEYFIGLELLRPLLIWIIGIKEDIRKRIRFTIRHWLPYLFVTGSYVIWRLFFFHSTRPTTDQAFVLQRILAEPVYELRTRVFHVFSDVLQSGFASWTQTLAPGMFNISVWAAVGWALVIFCAIAVFLYLSSSVLFSEIRTPISDHSNVSWASQAVGVGLFATIVAGLPIWFGGQYIDLTNFLNRYTLPMMFGAVVLVVGLVELLINTLHQRAIIISIMVGLAIGFHFRNANLYRVDWVAQKGLFWQLSWRVPGLHPGTSILMADNPSFISGDYALYLPLNFIYDPDHKTERLNYWAWTNMPAQLGVHIPRLANDVPLEDELRNIYFSGSTSKSLVIWFSSSGCIRVVDPQSDSMLPMPYYAEISKVVSHVDQIVVDPKVEAQPPRAIFGAEPEHGWCYYFQKAELSRQRRDWKRIAALADEALQKGLEPKDLSEWIVFIHGYLIQGRYENAMLLTDRIIETIPSMQPAICKSLARLITINGQDKTSNDTINRLNLHLSCPLP